MDQTYLHSDLTISADDSVNTQAGFLHHRNPLETQSCVIPGLVLPYDQLTPGSLFVEDKGKRFQWTRDYPVVPVSQ
jgi:hypothetical protein